MRKTLATAAAVATVPASLIVWLTVHHQSPTVAAVVIGALIGTGTGFAVDTVARRRRRSSSTEK